MRALHATLVNDMARFTRDLTGRDYDNHFHPIHRLPGDGLRLQTDEWFQHRGHTQDGMSASHNADGRQGIRTQ